MQLGELLLARHDTVAVAESCTGGGLAQSITAVPGSSNWFEAGFVTYSNRMKSKVLGVDPRVIESHGAVSEEVVRGMLSGALTCAEANVGAAISGIAGPGGATLTKAVGTVCFAVGDSANIIVQTRRFSGDRSSVREQSVIQVLQQLLEFCRLE